MRTMSVRSPGGLDNLIPAMRGEVPLGPTDVLLRVRASSLNYHDYVVAAGILPVKDGLVPLSDAAGDVLAVGAEVRDFQVGDRAMSAFYPAWQQGPPDKGYNAFIPGDTCDGFGAEQVVVDQSWLTRLPEGYDYCEAASLTCAGLTAWAGTLRHGLVGPGTTVLVQGTGGVSIFALQFAKAAGATVIATSSSDAKLERLRALGADHVINYRDEPQWGKRATELTGGVGVDLVVEVGGVGTMAQSIEACRSG